MDNQITTISGSDTTISGSNQTTISGGKLPVLEPLSRAEKTVEILLENAGKRISVSGAMKEAGYSDAYARNPQDFKATKTWEELMEKYIPDHLIAQAHNKLLTAKRVKRVYLKGDLQEETVEEDTYALTKGVELGYKVKDKFPAEKKKISGKLDLATLITEAADNTEDEKENDKSGTDQ